MKTMKTWGGIVVSAGICIMNKNAIALAADSAVTVGPHLAIHNSANKLFALSKVAPVGIIIYSSSEVMEIPVEIIIKQYKHDLKRKTFDSLEEYVQDFISYMLCNKQLFRFDENEKRYIKSVYVNLLDGLNNDYSHFVSGKINEVHRELTAEELANVQQKAIDQTVSFIDGLSQIPNFDVTEYITLNYGDEIREYISKKFPWIAGDVLDTLSSKVCTIFNKEFFRNGYVGIAFAGYGNRDIFPKMCHIHLSGVISNHVRYIVREEVAITEESSAAISPFAQTDVMQTFLFGINDSFINALANEIPKQIQNIFQSINNDNFIDGKKEEVLGKLASATPNIINQIVAKAQQEYLRPITQSVATLPIEELALLAESMINITSLRRKVAIDNNIGTVGGPIDVGMITKSDGFIWIKRKHYFEQSYNPQYFYSHYMLEGNVRNEYHE